jgi:hypothetical protein
MSGPTYGNGKISYIEMPSVVVKASGGLRSSRLKSFQLINALPDERSG